MRALSYYISGDAVKGSADMQQALSLGVKADPEFLRSLGFTSGVEAIK